MGLYYNKISIYLYIYIYIYICIYILYIIIIIVIINEIFVMRLSKQTPQKHIAADYIDLKSSVLNSFLKAAKVNVKSFRVVGRMFQYMTNIYICSLREHPPICLECRVQN